MPNTTSLQRWSRNESTSDVARGQASAVKRSRNSAQRASVSAETLTERAYRALEEEIVTLRLKPSQVLSEQMLSATFKIGRTPIREALQRLAREGLVAILPRKGILVSDINPRNQLLVLEVRREIERLLRRTGDQRATAATAGHRPGHGSSLQS